MLSLLKRKKPTQKATVKLNMPIMEDKVKLDTTITEEETDIDFSDLEMLKENLSVPALFEQPSVSKPRETKNITKKLTKDTEKPSDESTKAEPKETDTKKSAKMSKNIYQKTITTETTKRAKQDVELKIPATMIKIGDEEIGQRIPEEKKQVNIKVPAYYMNNREVFTSFINSIFACKRRIRRTRRKFNL